MTAETKINIGGVDATPAKAPPKKKAARKVQADYIDTPYDTFFPDGCPIEPLGVNGDDVFFLDQKRQLRIMKGKDLNRGTIVTLLGEAGDLKFKFWPRHSYNEKSNETTLVGWRPEQAADCLYTEAARRGIWDILDRVRGPGCWVDGDGKLIMHCGDELFMAQESNGDASFAVQSLEPGQVGRHVYPSAPPKPHPAESLIGTDAAEELLALLKTWNWRRPDVDPYLLLGWIAAAMLGGALKWRPLIWITGDKATGKSTLHEVLKDIMGPGGMISATDTTESGVRQVMGHSSMPIALDELESEEDNRKSQNIVKLARHASSGGQTLRGGADHKGSSFTIRSCFLFSSILIPPMLGQDVSRMAVLNLDKLTGPQTLHLEPKRLAEIGAAFRARLMQQWPRMDRVLRTWKDTLGNAGHSGRGSDQFGTLLACLDLLLIDGIPHTDRLDDWADQLKAGTLAECEDDISNHQRCLNFLLTAQLDLYRGGERQTIGTWVRQAAGLDGETQKDRVDANRALGNIGLLVQDKPLPGGGKIPYLVIANDHQGLAGVFRESPWKGQAGATGVWVQAVRRCNGHFADQQRFNGVKARCTAVPLEEILGVEDE